MFTPTRRVPVLIVGTFNVFADYTTTVWPYRINAISRHSAPRGTTAHVNLGGFYLSRG